MIPQLLHEPQEGFVLGRSSCNHLRILADLPWHVRDDPSEILAFCLGEEKVFNRAEWPYLYQAMSHLGAGQQLQWEDSPPICLTDG